MRCPTCPTRSPSGAGQRRLLDRNPTSNRKRVTGRRHYTRRRRPCGCATASMDRHNRRTVAAQPAVLAGCARAWLFASIAAYTGHQGRQAWSRPRPGHRAGGLAVSRNLGACGLRRKRRAQHPMDAFDALPAPLRQWLAEAALPWSPTSARRIWARSLSKGLSVEEALACLRAAEARTLARDPLSDQSA
ncbi:MAG: DUF6525 family protein [Pseudomonadota bacterium]